MENIDIVFLIGVNSLESPEPLLAGDRSDAASPLVHLLRLEERSHHHFISSRRIRWSTMWREGNGVRGLILDLRLLRPQL